MIAGARSAALRVAGLHAMHVPVVYYTYFTDLTGNVSICTSVPLVSATPRSWWRVAFRCSSLLCVWDYHYALFFPSFEAFKASQRPLQPAELNVMAGQGAAAIPPAARTAFTFVAGSTAAATPPKFAVVDTSPLVTSLVFLPWEVGAAGTPARVVRSSVVGAILMATRRPADADLPALCRRSILTAELLASEASKLVHCLDAANAFDAVYATVEKWEAAIPGILASMAAPSLQSLCLKDSMFYDGLTVTRNTASEVLFLSKVSVGDLVRTDAAASDGFFVYSSLSRAFFLLGWKEESTLVNDEDSEVRQVVERVKRLLARRMPDPDGTASDAAYGREACSLLADLKLPLAFAKAGVIPMHACEELAVTFDYWRGTPAQVQSIQLARFLGVPRQFPDVGILVRRFSDPSVAFTQTEMVAAHLLPASLSAVSLLARLSQLDTRLATASWRATITHITTTPIRLSAAPTSPPPSSPPTPTWQAAPQEQLSTRLHLGMLPAPPPWEPPTVQCAIPPLQMPCAGTPPSPPLPRPPIRRAWSVLRL